MFFFYLRLNKRLSKQSWGWWFETLSCPLWRHCNEPLYKGHPRWWPFKRGGLSWEVKQTWFVKNGTWKWTNFANLVRLSWNFQGGSLYLTSKIPVSRTSHDYVTKWKHFPRYWPFVRGIHRSPVNSPHKGQWRGALVFSLICAWINGWVNNREAGDFRRHHAHYDVTVMVLWQMIHIRSGHFGILPLRKLANKLWKPVLHVDVISN